MHDILGDGFELGDVGGAFEGVDGVSVAEFVGGEVGDASQVADEMEILLYIHSEDSIHAVLPCLGA